MLLNGLQYGCTRGVRGRRPWVKWRARTLACLVLGACALLAAAAVMATVPPETALPACHIAAENKTWLRQHMRTTGSHSGASIIKQEHQGYYPLLSGRSKGDCVPAYLFVLAQQCMTAKRDAVQRAILQ